MIVPLLAGNALIFGNNVAKILVNYLMKIVLQLILIVIK